jgi:hypothetical protein
MKKLSRPVVALLLFGLGFSACKKETAPTTTETSQTELLDQSASKKKPAQPATMTVLATGLNNPRGLKFGPDDNLYVAEAGIGGSQTTVGLCPQAPTPIGPFKGSADGGRVSMITMNGTRTTVSDKLPSSQDADPFHPNIYGPADVAFIGNQLYVLVDGAGCSHGVLSMPSGIVKINPGGTPTLVANLSDWLLAHPPGNPSLDFDPLGVWYSMIADGNKFYALNANQGTFVEAKLDGSIKLIADMSVSLGHVVPTALTEKGNFYIGALGTFPITGESAIYKMTPGGNVKVDASGFSAITGLVLDWPRMYVLEMAAGVPFPAPGTGRIVRVNPNGSKDIILTGLTNPTAMTMGPDGNLYVSNWGFGRPPGGGEIVKVELSN